jgi:hypothetical protein
MHLRTILICSTLALLPGCASTPILYTPAEDLKECSLSRRDLPARVVKRADRSLVRNDILVIGWLTKTESIRTCRGYDCDASFQCPPPPAQKDVAREMAAAAASFGGDVLELTADRVLTDRPLRNSGAGEPSRRDDGTGQDAPRGRECVLVSSGTVWRYGAPEELTPLIRSCKFRSMKKAYASMQGEGDRRSSDDVKRGKNPYRITVNGRYGFAVTGRGTIIEPQFTDAKQRFSEGLGAVAVGEKEGKRWGFIDRTGTWVLLPAYDDADTFHEGLAAVRVNNRYGYIDKKGTFVIKPQFDEALLFSRGIARVTFSGKEAFINKAGDLFTEP